MTTMQVVREEAPGVQDWIQLAIETTQDSSSAPKSLTNSFFSNIDTKFFLVNTKHPGNVGSSARSMKTMGFSPEGLVVVDPSDSRVLGRKKCFDAASGAVDVLENAVLVVQDKEDGNHSSLKDTVQQTFGDHGPILVCGTGMPVDMSQKRPTQRYLEPRKFFDRILATPPVSNHETDNDDNPNSTLRIAFVFGNERYGMLPEDIEACDVMLGIPTHPSFGSLNLATAVQIIAYDWRQALGGF